MRYVVKAINITFEVMGAIDVGQNATIETTLTDTGSLHWVAPVLNDPDEMDSNDVLNSCKLELRQRMGL